MLIPLGILAQGVAGIKYWLAVLGDTGSEAFQSVAIQDDEFLYGLGQTNSQGAGSTDFLLTKYNANGGVEWQRILGGASADSLGKLNLDSTGNPHFVGTTSSAGPGGSSVLFSKYDTSGTIQWQRIIGGALADIGSRAALDSSDNLYVFGSTNNAGAGNRDFLLAKFDTTPTIQWQRVLGGAQNETATDMAVTAAGDIYFCGSTASAGFAAGEVFLAKYNTSGTIQWQRRLRILTQEASGQGIALDSSENVYVCGFFADGGSFTKDMLLAKYNSSGTLQWQRALGQASTGFELFNSVAVGDDGFIYVAGTTPQAGAGGEDIVVAKYDDAGTIQWQRTIGGTGADRANGISVRGESVYIVGDTFSTGAGAADCFIASIPTDGSLTGSYTLAGETISYSVSSLTASTPSMVGGTPTLTAGTSTLVVSTPTLTAATSTLTPDKIDIG